MADNLITPDSGFDPVQENCTQKLSPLGDDLKLDLPEKPEEPLQSDCCGTGCTPCVFDLYDQEVKQWEEECRQIREGRCKNNDSSSIQDSLISTSKYHTFQIESIKQDSHDSYIFRFKLNFSQTLGLKVGQHIILRWKNEERSITRQYTPVSELSARGHFDILIKIYEDGQMSQYVKTWKVGDQIEWRGPYGRLQYTPRKWRRLLLLAAGTGVAPMAQVISEVLQDEEDETRLRLVYCCKTYPDLLLKDRLDTWADYWNFSALYLLSRDSADSGVRRRYGDDVRYQRLDEDLLKDELGEEHQDTFILICGTKSFDKDMVNYLRRLGVPETNYFRF